MVTMPDVIRARDKGANRSKPTPTQPAAKPEPKTGQTKEELKFKDEHGLDDHVRVSLGKRPKRIVPVARGQNVEPAGLGDVIARWTHSMGIKQCAGCRRRQVALNRIFPRRRRSTR